MKVVLVVVFGAVLAACHPRLPPPSPPRSAQVGLEISQEAFSNGLRAVLVRDRAAPDVQVTVRYGVGSVDDPVGREELAHLAEHLMFDLGDTGTIMARLEDTASAFNAFTTADGTTYISRAPLARLGELLAIEHLRLSARCATLTDEAFAREVLVVRNELAPRIPLDAARELVFAALYPEHHPYRRRAGTAATLAAITRDEACAFIDAHYTPGNAVVVVSGDLTREELSRALAPLGAIPARTAAKPVIARPVPSTARRISQRAAIDRELAFVAWPLPSDPTDQIRLASVAAYVLERATASGSATIAATTFGDARAAQLVLVVRPFEGRLLEDALQGIAAALGGAHYAFGPADSQFEPMAANEWITLRERARFGVFEVLEAHGRDALLAAAVLDGRDPASYVEANVVGLGTMTREEAVEIAKTQLSLERATIVRLVPDPESAATTAASTAIATPPIHDRSVHRAPVDPALATQPLAVAAPGALVGERRRTLANGMLVVLLPTSNVPTLDVRLMFASGIGDELPGATGAATLAAQTLDWQPRHLNDVLLYQPGTTHRVELGLDLTQFHARGHATQVDTLLAGLRRLVRDGYYGDSAAGAIAGLRARVAPGVGDAIEMAWREALYGRGHPYASTGNVHQASQNLTLEDLERYRAAYYVPGNATLVIAGQFDPATADRWIDFLFDDWTAAAPRPRRSPAIAPRPAAIAIDEAASQVTLRIALPATGSRAVRLVIAQMLDELAGIVRFELGASYGFDVALAEKRLASHYMFSGMLDAARAAEATAALRARFEELRTDATAVAKLFVSARARAYVALVAASTGSRDLGARAAHELATGRAIGGDRADAIAVRDLALADVTAQLAQLELAAAAIMAGGPAETVDAMFAALDRAPQRITLPAARASTPITAPAPVAPDASVDFGNLDPALAQQPRIKGVIGRIGAGPIFADAFGASVSGGGVTGSALFVVSDHVAIGGAFSVGHATGTYERSATETRSLAVTPLTMQVGAQLALGPAYATALAGLAIINVEDYGRSGLHPGFAFGGELGVDVVTRRHLGVGLYVRAWIDVLSDVGLQLATAGLAIRL